MKCNISSSVKWYQFLMQKNGYKSLKTIPLSKGTVLRWLSAISCNTKSILLNLFYNNPVFALPDETTGISKLFRLIFFWDMVMNKTLRKSFFFSCRISEEKNGDEILVIMYKQFETKWSRHIVRDLQDSTVALTGSNKGLGE